MFDKKSQMDGEVYTKEKKLNSKDAFFLEKKMNSKSVFFFASRLLNFEHFLYILPSKLMFLIMGDNFYSVVCTCTIYMSINEIEQCD